MPEPGDSDKNLNFGFVPPSIFRESNPQSIKISFVAASVSKNLQTSAALRGADPWGGFRFD
jgi:hypothetical protein